MLEHEVVGLLRLDVKSISRSEAVLDTPLGLDTEGLLEVILELPREHSLVLPARIVGSGDDGLRIQWRFYDASQGNELEAALLAHADETVAQARREAEQQKPPSPDPVPDETAPSPRVEIDGKLDVEATLRSRSMSVKSKNLAKRYDNVRVLRLSAIAEFIQEAVDEAVEKIDRNLNEKEKQELLDETERAFEERMEEFRSQNADLQARSQSLEKQLERASSVLEEERLRIISRERFLVSDAGLAELDRHMQHLIDRSLKAGDVDPDTVEEMRSVVEKLLDREREKITKQAEQAQGERVELLERKVSRLSRSLDETREQRDLARIHAQQAQAGSGGAGPNVYQPGINVKDPLREEKLALLDELIEENFEVRKYVTKE